VLKERGHEIERKRIELKGGIKQIGTYSITVNVHPQLAATVTIEVVDAEGIVTSVGEADAAAATAAAEAEERARVATEALQAADAPSAPGAVADDASGADGATEDVSVD